ncbi:MAG: hypothetical protein R3B13_07105 [Polyangiaceae bacterium]
MTNRRLGLWGWLALMLLTAAACTLAEPLDGFAGPTGAGGATDSGAGGGVVAGGGGIPTVECTKASQCSDGNACNGNEVCTAEGKCAPGTAPAVDDGNSCTVDSCDPKKGVLHEGGAAPPTKACGAADCPAGFYLAAALACDPECGTNNCGFCINGFLCQQACLPKVQVCCKAVGCSASCPIGYVVVKEYETETCGCGPTAPGKTAECQRQ